MISLHYWRQRGWAGGPSVIQVRVQDLLPKGLRNVHINAIKQFCRQLEEGALISIDPQRALSLVKGSCSVLGTVLNKAWQMAATPGSIRKLLGQ